MKIEKITGFATSYTVRNGGFQLSGGRRFTSFPSVVLRIDTDEDISGWGEHASSSQYMVAHHSGAIAVLKEVAPALIGMDPRQISLIHETMNNTLMGHAYAKTAVDIACWDIAGKAAGVPIAVLLGGIHQPRFPMLKMAIMDEPEVMAQACRTIAKDGFRVVQIKIGSDWRKDVERIEACVHSGATFDKIIADANANYLPQEALSLLEATKDLDFVIEQPCRDLATNLSVRHRTSRAFVLDESLDGIGSVFQAYQADGFDQAMLKLSRFGGISPLAFARDCCVAWGRPVTMEDMSGGGIIAAASAHLAASTPARYLVAGSFSNTYVEETYIKALPLQDEWPKSSAGRLPTQAPGLGVEVDEAALGAPIFSIY